MSDSTKRTGLLSRALEATVFGLGLMRGLKQHKQQVEVEQLTPESDEQLFLPKPDNIPVVEHRLRRNKFHVREGWSEAMPHTLPRPTYAPAALAFGVVFGSFGMLTKWYFIALGGVIILIAIWSWVMELVNE